MVLGSSFYIYVVKYNVCFISKTSWKKMQYLRMRCICNSATHSKLCCRFRVLLKAPTYVVRLNYFTRYNFNDKNLRRKTYIAYTIVYDVQLEGNLMCMCSCVSRIVWVAMRAPSKLYGGTHMEQLILHNILISKYGAPQS